MKTVQYSIRLDPEDDEAITSVAQSSGLARSAILTMMIRAAVDCVKRHNGEFPFPLRFEIERRGEKSRQPEGRLAPSQKA